MKKNLKMMSLLLCAVTVASCGGARNYAANNTEFFLGVSGPLTGDASSYGVAVQYSAQLAVDEINAAGGFKGTNFKVKALDDELLATKAANNYSNLYEGGMQAALGAVTSGACLEFASYAKQDNLFCLTPSATSDGVPEVGDNVYQMCFRDSAQGALAAEYINEHYPDANVGIFYDSSDDYSKGIYDNFTKTFKVKAEAAFTSSSKTDFSGQIQTLRECDFIFMPIYYTQAALFIQQAKDVFASDVVYFGCDGLDGIEGVEGFDPFAYPQEISYLSHFNPNSADPKVANYIRNYKAKYPNAPLNQFGASAYDCVYAIYGAMVASGKDIPVTISASDLCDILKEQFNNGFEFTGITGASIKWNADGTVSKKPTKYVVNERVA